MERVSRRNSYAREGEVVGIGAGKVKVLAVKLELFALDADKARLGLSRLDGRGGKRTLGEHQAEGEKGGGGEEHAGGSVCFGRHAQ